MSTIGQTTTAFPQPPPVPSERGLAPAAWGMLAFLLSEVAFFSTLIVAYVTFMGRDIVGPTPREALSLTLALAGTACLLASSFTVHAAHKAIEAHGRPRFLALWGLTI